MAVLNRSSTHKTAELQQSIHEWKKRPEIRQLVMVHSDVSFSRQLLSIAFDWFVILASITAATLFPGLLMTVLAVLLIGSRQQAFLLIMHEGAHYRISKNRLINDLVSDFFAAFPIFAATAWYRNHHHEHHHHLNTDRDPDWARKIHLKEWQFPQEKGFFFFNLGMQVIRGGIEWITVMTKMAFLKTNRRVILLKLAYYGTLAALTTAFGVWPEVLLYWMLPLMTVLPILQRFRSITEHFGLEQEHDLNHARNTLTNPVGEFFISPHGTNYHLVHHLFPSVPHYNLAKVHQKLSEHEIYQQHAHLNEAYLFGEKSTLKDLIK